MSHFWIRNAWLVPFFPLLGGTVAAAGARWLRQQAHVPVVAGIALSFLVALGLLAATSPDASIRVHDWLTISGLAVPIEFRLDGLTTLMLAMVTFVAILIAVFAAHFDASSTRVSVRSRSISSAVPRATSARRTMTLIGAGSFTAQIAFGLARALQPVVPAKRRAPTKRCFNMMWPPGTEGARSREHPASVEGALS